MARHHTGCEVLHQDFLALDLPAAHFDGVFPNASLFHVPAQELPRVLGEPRATLRPRGKTLYLGLGKTGQISAKAVEHPRLKKLVDPARSRSS